MPERVEAFKCAFCHRCFGKAANATVHENACKNNPTRRNCKTCVHGVVGKIALHEPLTIESFLPYLEDLGDPFYDGPYCGYHEKPVSDKPYYFDCDIGGGFDTGLGYYPEYPMPGTCFHYVYKGNAKWTSQEEYKQAQADGSVEKRSEESC